MSKRDGAIGRAAYNTSGWPGVLWDDMSVRSRQDHIDCALAAVAAAREIDTCGTCKHSGGCAVELGIKNARKRGLWLHGDFGCNRHQPKEGE